MPTPAPGTDPVLVAATICRRRGDTWSTLLGLTDSSDPAWAASLTDRLDQLRSGTAWLDDAWRPDGVLLLEGLVRRAARRGVDDLQELVTDSAVAAQPGLRRLHRHLLGLHELCTAELERWDAHDADGAKALRVEQMTLLTPGSPVRAEASRLGAARLPVWSPVADVVTAYLLLETGR